MAASHKPGGLRMTATDAMAANSAALSLSAGSALDYSPLGDQDENHPIGVYEQNTAIPLPREMLEWWYAPGDPAVEALSHVKLRRDTPAVALADEYVAAYSVGRHGQPVVPTTDPNPPGGPSPPPGVPLPWSDPSRPLPPVDAMTAHLSAVRFYNVRTRRPIREPAPKPRDANDEKDDASPCAPPSNVLIDGNGRAIPVELPTRGAYFTAITETQARRKTAFQLNFNPYSLNADNDDPFFLGRPAAWSKYFVSSGFSNAGFFEVPQTNVGGDEQAPMPFLRFHDDLGGGDENDENGDDDDGDGGDDDHQRGDSLGRREGRRTTTRRARLPLSRLSAADNDDLARFPMFAYERGWDRDARGDHRGGHHGDSPGGRADDDDDDTADQPPPPPPRRDDGLTISEHAILTGHYRTWAQLNVAMHMVKSHLDRHRMEGAATKYVNFVNEFLPHFKDLGILDDASYIDEEKHFFGEPCERPPGLYVAPAEKTLFWHQLYNLTYTLLCKQAALAGLVIAGTHRETQFGVPLPTRLDTTLAGQMYRRADMKPEAWWPHNREVDQDWTNYFHYLLSGGGAGNHSGRMLEVITGLNIEALNKLMFRSSSSSGKAQSKGGGGGGEASLGGCTREAEDRERDDVRAREDDDREDEEEDDTDDADEAGDDEDDEDNEDDKDDKDDKDDEDEESERDDHPASRAMCTMAGEGEGETGTETENTLERRKRKRDDDDDDDDDADDDDADDAGAGAGAEAAAHDDPARTKTDKKKAKSPRPDIATFHAIQHVRRAMIKLYCALFGESGPPRPSAEGILRSESFQGLLHMADRCLRDFGQMDGDILTMRPLLDLEIYDRPSGLEYRPTLDRYSV